MLREELDGDADQETAKEIRGERSKRQVGQDCIECNAQPPANLRAEGGTDANCNETYVGHCTPPYSHQPRL